MDQIAAPELLFHCDQRHQRHPVLHADEVFDVLDRGQLNVHVEQRAVLLESNSISTNVVPRSTDSALAKTALPSSP